MMNLENLNKSQKEAVLQTSGPVMVLAGAGSGKTRTLVKRIEYLLEEKSVGPHQVLAVTFSNKAAREMKERVATSTKYDIGALQITTFHAFCAKLLRFEAKYIGLSRNFTIYDSSEQKAIIKNILGNRGISPKEIHPSEVHSYIENLKNSGHYLNATSDLMLDPVDKDDTFYKFFEEYEGELLKSNALDFGGLITGVLNLFDNFPDVLARYQKRFEYILVDEYQDTNRCQFKLVKLLSESKKNICVVGDEDQSIYSWRGADIRNILDFEKYFPEARIIKLEQNYRSSKNIIEAATCVISQNTQRKGKKLWTENDSGDSIEIIECSDDKVEGKYIAESIKELLSSGTPASDIAIFYRTNAQSRQIEDALRLNRISYRVVAGIKFYERKEIKDILSYLKVIVNPKDSLSLTRIINIPARGVGIKTLRKIEEVAIKEGLSLWETIANIVDNIDNYSHLKLSSKVKSSLREFETVIQEAKLANNDAEKKPSFIYEQILHNSGYYEFMSMDKTYESKARIENLEELLSAIKQYENDNEKPTLEGFLETITLDTEVAPNLTDEDTNHESLEQVSMMTIHSSKGLEYPYVFVSGVEESLFPSFQSLESGEDAIEEERRLFYVAITRAMKKLYILFANGRMLWGSIKFNGPSRFIHEIPKDYYSWRSYGRTELSKEYDEFDQSYEGPSEKSFYAESKKKRIPSTYEPGSQIKHKLYGDGKVIETNGAGTDEKVTIMFRNGIKKKFMVKFAPLERRH